MIFITNRGEMIVVDKKDELQKIVSERKRRGEKVGFVPTMGALHQGHISLVQCAREKTDFVVASIFVNPIQFNIQSDFDTYPITITEDKAKLADNGCDIVFIPSVEEMYPEKPAESYNFGQMETVMEGACRPGHFNGVAVVVRRLFDLVQPDFAFFGQKDFQQLAIIKQLVAQLELPVQIVPCPTIRESDGLAMSSRNVRLNQEQRQASVRISSALRNAITGIFGTEQDSMVAQITDYINQDKNLDVEYISIVDSTTLQHIAGNDLTNAVVCAAVFAGDVRLIDNMVFTETTQPNISC